MKTNIQWNKKAIIVWGLLLIVIVGWQLPLRKYAWGVLQAHVPRVAGQTIAKLNVPYHRQEHSLSCEIASLKMALSYAGFNISEDELIQSLHFDQTPRSRTLWGDPFKGFVGDIDGKMGKTGYGVYWDPIVDVGNRYAPTRAFTGLTAADFAEHILNNRPVVVWGYFGRGAAINWETTDGNRINAINGEHARIVTGFTGSKENPEGFFLLDPIYGELYWSTEKFMKNGEPFDNAGVVVY